MLDLASQATSAYTSPAYQPLIPKDVDVKRELELAVLCPSLILFVQPLQVNVGASSGSYHGCLRLSDAAGQGQD